MLNVPCLYEVSINKKNRSNCHVTQYSYNWSVEVLALELIEHFEKLLKPELLLAVVLQVQGGAPHVNPGQVDIRALSSDDLGYCNSLLLKERLVVEV